MPRESAEIRLIRETLEGVLHPATASAMLFEALRSHGVVPSASDEVSDFVGGALTEGLVERLGEEMAASVIDQIRMTLRSIPDSGRKRGKRQEEQTLNLELRTDTFPLFMLSSTTTFAKQLLAALGPKMLTIVMATDAKMWRDRVEQVPPAFVLVDAADFPAIEPEELVQELASQPPEVVKAIWGADLPYGMSLIAAAHARALSLTPFDRREGIAPLMDMIRSRRAPR